MIVSNLYRLLSAAVLLTLAACQTTPQNHKVEDVDNGFTLRSVVKSDIDMVFDHQVRVTEEHLRELMQKLYLRNPIYWRQTGAASAQARVNAVFDLADVVVSRQLRQTRSIESIQLAFDNSFSGDRVLAFVYGLKTMLDDSYGGKKEFFILDQLDPQRLYNAARNIEVAVWKLSNDRDENGQLYLVSNQLNGGVKNLSFERLFGKMIAIQDSSATIVADSTNRAIKNMLQGVARYVFLPI